MRDFGGVFGWISPMQLGDLEYLLGGFYLRKSVAFNDLAIKVA